MCLLIFHLRLALCGGSHDYCIGMDILSDTIILPLRNACDWHTLSISRSLAFIHWTNCSIKFIDYLCAIFYYIVWQMVRRIE